MNPCLCEFVHKDDVHVKSVQEKKGCYIELKHICDRAKKEADTKGLQSDDILSSFVTIVYDKDNLHLEDIRKSVPELARLSDFYWFSFQDIPIAVGHVYKSSTFDNGRDALSRISDA